MEAGQADSTPGSLTECKPKEKTVKDFEFLKTLGEGSYGIVKLAIEKDTRLQCAIKIVDKAQIVKLNKQKQCMRERNLLDSLRHPYILALYFTFHDPHHLCLSSPLISHPIQAILIPPIRLCC
eukprot:TRINITY_DN4116_c0_g1_i2.p1 TRINITY_DN4116_c0_g1~~TRINITY_DN4116_c0_g1_i2.p1  ORF type:complete len:123 (-),score=8.90 TRINITY_DN4116_c0_g1_i2:5-373(-)